MESNTSGAHVFPPPMNDELSVSDISAGEDQSTENPTGLTSSSVNSSFRNAQLSSNASVLSTTKKEGSLLRLFQSELFDTYFHMYYLYNRPESGIQDYLVNLLYRRSEADIHFYLPQLCCLCLARYKTSTLHRFILEKASKSMNLALKTSWLFHASAEDATHELRILSLQLNQEVEMAIVNSKPVPPGSAAYTPSLNVYVPDLFKRRRAVNKLRTTRLLDAARSAPSGDDARPSSSGTTHPYSDDEEALAGDASCSAPSQNDFIYVSAQQDDPKSSPRSQGRHQSSVKQRVAPGFVKRVGAISAQGARVKLPSVYSKLGSPFSYSSFRDTALMDAEMQQYIVKQRRCDYYNMVNSFISTIIDVSNRLAQEPDRLLRLPLLQSFLVALNEWMFCRRCIVAASEGTFTMTGLNIPLSEFGSLSSSHDTEATASVHSTQVLRFLPDECRVLSSKRRAPFLLVFEVADLDEDLHQLPSIFRLTTSEFSRAAVATPSEATPDFIKQRSPFVPLWNHLYVYGSILDELKERQLYTVPPHPDSDETAESPLTALRRCMALIASSESGIRQPPSPTVPAGCIRATSEADPLQRDGSGQLSPILVSLTATTSDLAVSEQEPASKREDHDEDIHLSVSVEEATHPQRLLPAVDPTTYSDLSPRLASANSNQLLSPTSRTSRSTEEAVQDVMQDTRSRSTSPLAQHQDPRNACATLKSPGPIDCPTTGNLVSPLRSSSVTPRKYSLTPSTGCVDLSPRLHPLASSQLGARHMRNSTTDTHGVPKRSHSTDALGTGEKIDAAESPCEPTPSELAARAASVRRRLWGNLWCERKEKYRRLSPYGRLRSWNLGCVLVKGGDDVRQEMLASQLIRQFKCIFTEACLPLYLRPYEILVTGANSGIMVFVPDTISFDALKKAFGVDSIAKVFDSAFADNPYQAKKNFIESHAAYSLVAYLFQVKDRHNGNFLLDAEGHVIHIDYGYMLSNSPGSVNFESSPFKLTTEFLDIMDGEISDNYEYFRTLIVRGFLEVRKHADRLLLLVEMMLSASKMPCFSAGPEATFAALKDRFMLNLTEELCVQRVVDLIDTSVNNWRTIQYDTFQRITNGIL